MEGKRVALTRVVHQALADFRSLTEDLSKLPTRLYDLVLIQTMVDSYHDASGYMCIGAVLLVPMEMPRTPQLNPSAAATSLETVGTHSIVWRELFFVNVIARLVIWGNPEGQVTNSDLELAGSVLRHICISNCFDIS